VDCLTLHCLIFEVLAASTQRISSTAVEVQVSVVQVPSHRHVVPCMPSNHRPLLAQNKLDYVKFHAAVLPSIGAKVKRDQKKTDPLVLGMLGKRW